MAMLVYNFLLFFRFLSTSFPILFYLLPPSPSLASKNPYQPPDKCMLLGNLKRINRYLVKLFLYLQQPS